MGQRHVRSEGTPITIEQAGWGVRGPHSELHDQYAVHCESHILNRRESYAPDSVKVAIPLLSSDTLAAQQQPKYRGSTLLYSGQKRQHTTLNVAQSGANEHRIGGDVPKTIRITHSSPNIEFDFETATKSAHIVENMNLSKFTECFRRNRRATPWPSLGRIDYV